jgi:thiol-disulfide isomerase/thioredoxin
MKNSRTIGLIIAVILIAASISYLEKVRPEKKAGNAAAGITIKSENPAVRQKENRYERAKEFVNPSGFINTDPFTVRSLIGKKVIMVMFWTYSCINCQREAPYVNAWYDKYHDKGLEIIGVHTPEFDFEKNRDNVLAAVRKFGVKYPVVQDNDYSTWIAYGNQYWPRKYLIDIDGFIAFDQIGEGGYDKMEKKIQDLLAERDARLGIKEAIPSGIAKPKAVEMETDKVKSPETYFGSGRNDLLGNGEPHSLGIQSFDLPDSFRGNTFYLGGSWKFDNEFAENREPGASLVYVYNAKNVYLVARAGKPIRIKVLKDGKALGSDAGSDVGADGYVTVKDARLYRLIEGSGYGRHSIKLIIENPGAMLFTFTFG